MIQLIDPHHNSLSEAVGQAASDLEGFSVIVPAFNEEHGLPDTIDRLIQLLKETERDWELIIVDDGSTDATGAVARSASGVRVLTHSRNAGYGASLKTGIQYAKHPLIVICDADGSYPIETIPHLLDLCADADMVVGSRTGSTIRSQRLRMFSKWFLVRFAEWITRRPIPDLNSGLRVFRKSVAQRFLRIFPDGFSFTTTITLATLTNRYRVVYEPIEYHPRIGSSKIRPIRDTLGFLQLILRTGIYFAPLRIFLPVAAVFFAAFLATLSGDIFFRENITERTIILLVAGTQIGMFALLADMIDKRS